MYIYFLIVYKSNKENVNVQWFIFFLLVFSPLFHLQFSCQDYHWSV